MSSREWFHLTDELDDPVSPELFHAAFPSPRSSTFVLDGSGSAKFDRFAFMGAEPVASFRAMRTWAKDAAGARTLARDALGRRTARIVIDDLGDADGQTGRGRREIHDTDAFEALRDFLSAHTPPPDVFDARFPFPFRSGLVGYFGYECGQLIERLPYSPRPSSGMPDIALSLHRWLIATSRESKQSWISVLGVGPTRSAAKSNAEAKRDRIRAAVRKARHERVLDETPASSWRGVGGLPPRGIDFEASRPSVPRMPRIEAVLSREEYIERVALAKDHITAGDTFEICLTTALRTPLSQSDAWTLFHELRRSNPAPFAAILDLPEGAVVSSSPERFLSLDARRIAESRPIKGTRPRGSSPEHDARLAHELATSEKDRAENAMIVDLVRNDFGRVCRFGTVQVPELFVVEPYATVHQLVSTVRGELEPDKDAIDLLRACFPPGSMTGAPKIEAMAIIERLEPVERGVYSGGLGWIDLGGAMDLSVIIRTAILRDGHATFSVGGAVVADSDPTAEYEEAEHKARALVAAIGAISSERAPTDVYTALEQRA